MFLKISEVISSAKEEKTFLSVGSILTTRDIPFPCLTNVGLRPNPPFYYSSTLKNENVRIEDSRSIQVTPLRYHNHQHHHHHHHHHHHGYAAINSTSYDITQSYVPQYGKSSFTDYMSGNLQSTNCIVKPVDKFVGDNSRPYWGADSLKSKTDSGNTALSKNSLFDLNSYASYSCYRNRPHFDVCNTSAPYTNCSQQGTLVQEAYEPALRYYNRCLDPHEGMVLFSLIFTIFMSYQNLALYIYISLNIIDIFCLNIFY